MTGVATRARELDAVRRDAADCRRCDLYRNATQTVFGEGRAGAHLMLVGEQPGDAEDEQGRPFVVTVHPSAVLRAGERRREMRTQLTTDLVVARDAQPSGEACFRASREG